MTPEHRNKLLRRLCLFAPALSLASIAVLSLTPLRGLVLRTSQTVSPELASLVAVAPAWGWGLLTLGCSAFTAVDLSLRRGKTGASLIVLAVFGTVLVFLTHVLVICAVAFAGCMIVFRGKSF